MVDEARIWTQAVWFHRVGTFNVHIVESSNSGFLILDGCQYSLPSSKFLALPWVTLQQLPLSAASKTARGNCDNHRTPSHTTHTHSFSSSAGPEPGPGDTWGTQGAPDPVGSRTELIPTSAQSSDRGQGDPSAMTNSAIMQTQSSESTSLGLSFPTVKQG